MLKFKEKFKSFACIGDTIRLPLSQYVDLVATIQHDEDSSPRDYDCYSDHEISRWDNQEWGYCGIVLTAEINYLAASTASIDITSIWSVELNIGDNNDHATECANDLLNDTDVNLLLESIAESLNDAAKSCPSFQLSNTGE